ncbi:MAG: alpha/beta hydrolase, partial [Pseudomonas sp.]
MRHDAFVINASDGTPLQVNHWYGDEPPRAAVMLAHGMAEHSLRYARLAEALVAAGFALYALDQRGHGATAERGTLGHSADDDGWSKVVGDLATLNHHSRHQHP